MTTASPTYQPASSLFDVPLKEWMVYLYLLVSPFYMFALVTTRDWPALWIVGFMLLLFVVQFFHSGFRFWLDSSSYSLLFFLAAYVVGTLIILFSDLSMTLLGRTPQERAITTLVRVIYVVIVYGLFINFLADADAKTLKRIFVVQIAVGSVIALFGIAQYITAAVFSWRGLIGIEGTNETFKMGSSFFGIGRSRVYRSAAIFSEPSAFGFFLVPLFIKVVLSFIENAIIVNKKVHLTLLGIFVLAILFNLSLTAIFSTAILMMVLFGTTFGGSRILLWIIVFTLICFGFILVTPVGGLLLGRVDRVFQFSDVSTLDRLFRVYVGFLVLLKSPLIGVGPGFYSFLYPIHGGVDRFVMATPLNVWLTFLTDIGILGIIPFLFFLRNIFSRAKKRIDRNPLVRVYFWSTVSFLLLLSTDDFWYLEVFWFDVAMLVVLSNGLFSSPVRQQEKVAFA
jgi:O-antigen ligase